MGNTVIEGNLIAQFKKVKFQFNTCVSAARRGVVTLSLRKEQWPVGTRP